MAWTGLSIVSSIFSFITNKSISDNNEFVIISMDVTNDNDIKYQLARGKFIDIIKELGIVLRVSSESIGVLKPLIIANGICFKFILNTNTYKKAANFGINHAINKFKDSINNSNNMERLIKEFNKSWNLNLSTKINNIDIKYMESIKRKENTVEIEMANNYIKGSIHKANNDINSEMMNVIPNPEGNTQTGEYIDVSDSDYEINYDNN